MIKSKQITIHIDVTDAGKNLEDDSEAKIPKGLKIKEIYIKPDKPKPSEKGKIHAKQKILFQPLGIVSNLIKTL